jgi:TRAP-type C4-dicarboxylate transport system permease small subunit
MSGLDRERQVVGPARLPSLLKGLRLILAVASALMVCLMMFLTFADVLGRYVFGAPLVGAYEVTEILMGLMIFGGLPLVSAARGHISVDFLSGALPPKLKTIQSIWVDAVCGFLSGVLAWRAWLYGIRLFQAGETTLELKISWGFVTQVVSILLLLTAIVFFANAWLAIRARKSVEKGV